MSQLRIIQHKSLHFTVLVYKLLDIHPLKVLINVVPFGAKSLLCQNIGNYVIGQSPLNHRIDSYPISFE